MSVPMLKPIGEPRKYSVVKYLTLTEAVVLRIKIMREERGWTQAQLAAACHLHQTTIWRLEERGKGLTLDQCDAIATGLGVAVKDLLP